MTVLSEPYSALLRLQISHEELSRWLAAPVPPASRWSDWRGISGQWLIANGQHIASSSDQELDHLLADCQALLARYPDNRAALKAFLASSQAENIQIAAHDRTGTHFVAGSLAYSESLYDLIAFLAVARGAADFLKTGDRGVALIHDYLWAEEDERETVAAIALAGPGESGFMSSRGLDTATEPFEALVEAMLEGKDDPDFHPRNQLGRL
ncbi:hypothetical protein [Stenotrophomonas maltophilia]|uniref:Uncharacterized protein n=1 Tax=Stenotrophomonas maltophilia TaxID=40324 RepID=A0AAJ2JFY5_STEMA|nr:hypothetical protein [Stenotrophomonas maltophilia]MDT3469850.1 hypothetical protein [Stenotrophomonas maltophilia]